MLTDRETSSAVETGAEGASLVVIGYTFYDRASATQRRQIADPTLPAPPTLAAPPTLEVN